MAPKVTTWWQLKILGVFATKGIGGFQRQPTSLLQVILL